MTGVRVAIQGDIGQPVYHVGDEAMTHAAVAELARRGVPDVVLLTRDLAATARYFPGVEAARTLVFPHAPADRERYLAEIKAVLAGEARALPDDDQLFVLLETLRDVDALFIAGGGNLNSRYGWLLYERAALAHVAIALGKQVVIGGQTLGPELSPTDRGTLANLLRNASLVGLREDHSLALAHDLAPGHPGLRACLDDAALLGEESSVHPRRSTTPGRGAIAVTFAAPDDVALREPAARAYARLVDAVAARLEAPVRFIPHMATPGSGDADEAFHAEIAAFLAAPAELAPIASALDTVAATRAARAVVTSRYHPLVFACAAGIPAVVVAPDAYTRVRLQGALDRWGIAQGPLDLAGVVAASGVRSSWLAPLAQARTPAPALVTAQARWWDAVAAALASREGRTRKLARHWVRTRRHTVRRARAAVRRHLR